MRKFSKNFYIRVCIVSVVILLIMAVSTLMGGRAGVISDFSNMIIQPVQKGISIVYSKVSGVIDSIANSTSYAEENALLRDRIAILESDYAAIDTYKAENERLKALLDMKAQNSELTLQGASVISIEADNWYNVVTIDKGSADDVHVNDVVVTPQGLVGTVCEVGTTWAKVREITDVESSISAVCARTGDRGVLEGDYSLGQTGKCKLNYLSKNAKIVIGDRIEISETGSVYPKGIYIGKVVEITDDEDGLTLSAIIQSEVEFNSLSQVLVGR